MTAPRRPGPLLRAARLRPRSFVVLVLIGFTLVSIPLGAAFVLTYWQLDRLAEQSDNAVYRSVRSTAYARLWREQISALERLARQYVVYGRADRLAAYAALREDFQRTVQAARPGDLAEDPLPQGNRRGGVGRREQAIFDLLRSPESVGPEKRVALAELAVLVEEARSQLAEANAAVARDADVLRRMAGQAQETLFWLAVALLPLVVAFAVVPFVLISRPVRQMDGAIRRLGDGRYDDPVRIGGPLDFQELGHRLDWLRQRLLELEAQKRSFLQHVSHELKTPLAAVREGAELLADRVIGPLNREQREVVRILREQSLRLQGLIDTLLAYSRLNEPDTGGGQLEELRLDDLVVEVLADHVLAIRGKGIVLERRLAALSVIGERAKLRAVIDNLVSNAIKYTPGGGHVRMKLTQRDGLALLDVRDDGPGVDGVDREHVFKAFYQAARQPPGPMRGTGLGLSIARECILRHGGEIELMPSSDCGAHFQVRVPIRPPVPAAVPRREALPASPVSLGHG